MFEDKQYETPSMEDSLNWISFNLKRLADLFEVYLSSKGLVKCDTKKNKYMRDK